MIYSGPKPIPSPLIRFHRAPPFPTPTAVHPPTLPPSPADRMGDAFDELQRALELHVGLKSPARAQAETLQQMVLCLSYIQSEVGKGQGATAGG